jgi:hypothetical protein
VMIVVFSSFDSMLPTPYDYHVRGGCDTTPCISDAGAIVPRIRERHKQPLRHSVTSSRSVRHS